MMLEESKDKLEAQANDSLEQEQAVIGEDNEAFHEHFRVKVDPKQELLRIDKYLLDRIRKSRSKIQAAAKAGCVLVNGKAVKSNYKVRPNDEIVIVLPKPPLEGKLKAEPMDLDIVYEDDDLMIVNKPAGLVVHPGVGNYTGTLVQGLMHHFQQLPIRKNSIEAEMRPGLVHRIDKDTTGLLVIAKSETAMTHLAKQFFDHTVKRRYVALVWGDVEGDQGTITGHIGRHLRYRQIQDVYPDGDMGKHAITHYKVLERFGYVTLIECRLETGRTHQIRVHFKYKNHPLFADAKYGGDTIRKGTIYTKYKQFVDNCFKLISRQSLHAQTLGFVHPTTGEEMEFNCPLPEDMEAVVEKWRKYTKR